ncbi:MAG: tRNA preQ1(34) S-adenosylmethionine ribosyltransferase-isomerase QueA [Gammaproteobacteria bacterium]|nr:tRNA preQ1(34) S-adenosylmethionine ribosyltransferase-isomerase QueA [Gammaproteobacteria bacterium]
MCRIRTLDWSVKPMQTSDFSYQLPESLIAQAPAPQRDASRLLRVMAGKCEHLWFAEFPNLLRAGDLLVLNDTRVIKARLRGEKDSGGQAELLIERIEADRLALCQVRVSKPLKPGRFVTVGSHRLEVVEREGQFYRLRFSQPVVAVLDEHGEVPLPPYIVREHATAHADEDRYQTVYGRVPGAVAAPTAGLHFTQALLEQISERGVDIARVTLHVGAGTFQPVRVKNLSEHVMHAERYDISADTAHAIRECRARGGRIVAVGTTVVRTLESAALEDGEVQAGVGETALFITPGYDFRAVDVLLTNFHLPESTLLMLVCAFAGYQRVMNAYVTAVAAGYRFFSYGDACFFERLEGSA